MVHVHADQVYMVYGNAPLSLAASILNSIIWVHLLWTVLDHARMTPWLFGNLHDQPVRFALSIRFHQVLPDEKTSTVGLHGR